MMKLLQKLLAILKSLLSKAEAEEAVVQPQVEVVVAKVEAQVQEAVAPKDKQ